MFQFGILGVLGIASLTDHCCQLMVRCKYYVIDKILEEETFKGQLSQSELLDLKIKLSKTLGYGDIGKKVFGNWCYHLIQALVWFTQFTTAMQYYIFIGNTIFAMYPIVPVAMNINNNTKPIHANQTQGHPLGYGVPMLSIPFLDKIDTGSHSHQKHTDHNINILSRRQLDYLNGKPAGDSFTKLLNFEDNVTSYSDNVTILPTSQFLLSAFTIGNNITQSPNYTTVEPNRTSTTSPTTPKKSTTLPPIPPTPAWQWTSSAPDLKLIVLFPLPFFLVTSLIKKVRTIAPLSGVATVFLAVGAVSVFSFLVHSKFFFSLIFFSFFPF